mgnify:CR=1 FL=1
MTAWERKNDKTNERKCNFVFAGGYGSAGSFKNPHLWRGLFGIAALGFSIWAFIDYVKSGEKNFGGKILFLIFLTAIVAYSFLALLGVIPAVCPINSIRHKL